MTWGNVALILAVVWGAAMTVLLWVMVGAMREWKRRDSARGKDMAALADAVRRELGRAPLIERLDAMQADVDRTNNQLVDLASLCRATERAVGGHTHPTKTDPGVQEAKAAAFKAQQTADAAYDLARHINQLDKTVEAMSVAMTARLSALEQAPPPVIPEPVDVVGVLQAALAPWVRKDPEPGQQPARQPQDAAADDTADPDPSLIFDPTYDEFPEPVQTIDATGLPVIPGMEIDIPVARWGLQ